MASRPRFMLPKENMGFVLLTNQTSSPFPAMAADVIWEIMLEDSTEPVSKESIQKTPPAKKKDPPTTNLQSQASKIEEILALRKPKERTTV